MFVRATITFEPFEDTLFIEKLLGVVDTLAIVALLIEVGALLSAVHPVVSGLTTPVSVLKSFLAVFRYFNTF